MNQEEKIYYSKILVPQSGGCQELGGPAVVVHVGNRGGGVLHLVIMMGMIRVMMMVMIMMICMIMATAEVASFTYNRTSKQTKQNNAILKVDRSKQQQVLHLQRSLKANKAKQC